MHGFVELPVGQACLDQRAGHGEARFYDCLTAAEVRFERWEASSAREKVSGLAKWRKLVAKILCCGSISGVAQAAEPQVSVACPGWRREAAAEVEARIRTTLLAESLDATRVVVACQSDTTSVQIESEQGALLRTVARRSSAIEDDVVAATEAALREIASRAQAKLAAASPDAQLVTAPPPTVAPALTPAPDAPALKAKVASSHPPAAPRRAGVTMAEVQASSIGERWGNHWAWGGEASLSVASASRGFGIVLGGRAALREPTSFDLDEWNASVRFAQAMPKLVGLRVTAGVGASLLVTAPATHVVSESSNLLSAAFVELRLYRPFWFGPFALAPALGVRLFSARRNVRVNAEERLALPLFVPQAALLLIYRRE
jgi:hypothetical protein